MLASNLSSTITSAVGSQVATASNAVHMCEFRTGSCCHYNLMYSYYAWMMIGNTVFPDKPAVSSAVLPLFIWGHHTSHHQATPISFQIMVHLSCLLPQPLQNSLSSLRSTFPVLCWHLEVHYFVGIGKMLCCCFTVVLSMEKEPTYIQTKSVHVAFIVAKKRLMGPVREVTAG